MSEEWFMCYNSSKYLSIEERAFLSTYTEREFKDTIPELFLINATRKMSIVDAVKSVMHYTENGGWKYFGENAYLNDTV